MKKEFEIRFHDIKNTKFIFAEFCKDTSNDLDERWELLVKAGEVGIGEQSDRTKFDLEYDDVYLYKHPMYMEKGETRPMNSILNSIKGHLDLTDEEIVTFKEHCLAGFYTHMIFDW